MFGAGFGNVSQDILEQKTREGLYANWHDIQRLFRARITPERLTLIQKDDRALTELAQVVHQLIPFPMRFLLREDLFTKFCLQHRAFLCQGRLP